MRNQCFCIGAVALAVFIQSHAGAFAEDLEGEALFQDLVARNAYPLTVDEDGASGEGFDFLVTEAGNADLFLLGEQHGTADIARLARHLYARLHDEAGYSHLAIEVGPYSTAVMEGLLRDENPQAFETYRDGLNMPLAFPFVFFGEELAFLRDVLRRTPTAVTLWGLDQEFVASGAILADRLEALAQTDAQREAAAQFREAALENPMLIGSAPGETFAPLASTFSEPGEAHDMIEEMIRSNRIYAPFMGRGGFGYLANLEREDQMKRNFLADYVRAAAREGAAPRVMVKLGANHTSYGRSPTSVPATGDFLREWGLANGLTVFNVHADCLGGEMRDVQSGNAVPCESYRMPEEGPMRSALALEGPMVVDLRPLRPYAPRWDFLDAETEALIFAYDAYVVFPDTTAAELLVPPLAP